MTTNDELNNELVNRWPDIKDNLRDILYDPLIWVIRELEGIYKSKPDEYAERDPTWRRFGTVLDILKFVNDNKLLKE